MVFSKKSNFQKHWHFLGTPAKEHKGYMYVVFDDIFVLPTYTVVSGFLKF
jgi:hypothetical protein